MRLTPLLRRGILDSPMIISLHSTDGNPDQSATCVCVRSRLGTHLWLECIDRLMRHVQTNHHHHHRHDTAFLGSLIMLIDDDDSLLGSSVRSVLARAINFTPNTAMHSNTQQHRRRLAFSFFFFFFFIFLSFLSSGHWLESN